MNKYLWLGIFLCAISSTFAQESKFSRKDSISLVLKDGTVKNGFGHWRDFGRFSKKGDIIVYKESKGAVKEVYDYKTVKKLTLHRDEFDVDFEYKILDGTGGYGSISLLQLVIVGKIMLYAKYVPPPAGSFGFNPTESFGSGPIYVEGMFGTMDINAGGPPSAYAPDYHDMSGFDFFMAESGSDNVTCLSRQNTHSKKFKRIAKEYFSSCPILLERIDNDYYDKHEGLQEIVRFYNEECN